jgi:hypothetical protein
MTFNRLRLWRRRWCARRGHEQAAWSPVVLNWCEPDYWDGEKVIPGEETRIVAYRCARHDKEER